MSAQPKRKSGRTRKTSYEDPERHPSPLPSTVWVDPKQRFIDGLPKASMARKTTEKYETGLLGEEWDVEGYVTDVWREDSTTRVYVIGVRRPNSTNMGGWVLDFPPNDPKDLVELVRAQTHPHLRVYVWGIMPKKLSIRIDGVWVSSDYGLKPILGKYLPPFDVRETKPATGQLQWP